MFMKYLNRPHNLIHYNFFTFNRNYLEYVGFSKNFRNWGKKYREKLFSRKMR